MGKLDMILDTNQKFEYLDKHDFLKKTRSLKTYCPRAYKDFIFNIDKKELYNLPNGRYLKKLYTSDEFRFVYGQIKLIFSINEGNIIFENLEPQQFLLDGYYNLLGVYRGLPYRNIKDKFKIDLLSSIKKYKELRKK